MNTLPVSMNRSKIIFFLIVSGALVIVCAGLLLSWQIFIQVSSKSFSTLTYTPTSTPTKTPTPTSTPTDTPTPTSTPTETPTPTLTPLPPNFTVSIEKCKIEVTWGVEVTSADVRIKNIGGQ